MKEPTETDWEEGLPPFGVEVYAFVREEVIRGTSFECGFVFLMPKGRVYSYDQPYEIINVIDTDEVTHWRYRAPVKLRVITGDAACAFTEQVRL